MANSDVKLKHKVKLRKKVEIPVTPTPPEKSDSKVWVWFLLGAVVLCVIGYFIFSKSEDTPVTKPAAETEIAEETLVNNDSLTNQEEATEENVIQDENKVSNKADNQESNLGAVSASNIATSTKNTTSNTIVSYDVEA